MKPINWPSPGDKIFERDLKTPGLRANTAASFMDLVDSDSGLAYGFKSAADKIVENFDPDGSEAPECYLVPVVFLYRHSIELLLKNLLRWATRLNWVNKSKRLEDDLSRHDLRRLWSRARPAIERRFPTDDRAILQAAEDLLLELHDADPASTSFRYARDREGKRSLDGIPPEVGLRHVRGKLVGLYNFLDACEGALKDALEDALN